MGRENVPHIYVELTQWAQWANNISIFICVTNDEQNKKDFLTYLIKANKSDKRLRVNTGKNWMITHTFDDWCCDL